MGNWMLGKLNELYVSNMTKMLFLSYTTEINRLLAGNSLMGCPS